MNEMENIIAQSVKEGIKIKAMVIISPNNPAGFLFTHD